VSRVNEDFHGDGTLLAAEALQDLVGQGLEERIGNHEFVSGYADPRLPNAPLAEQSEFRHRLIAFAKHQRLARNQFRQIARQIDFCGLDTDPLHNYIVNDESSQVTCCAAMNPGVACPGVQAAVGL